MKKEYKYLDKEDIAECGWTHTGGQMVSRGKQEYRIDVRDDTEELSGVEYILYHTQYIEKILILKTNYSDMGGDQEVIYNGKCPSINELKMIMELLDIK
jgi:hypothetical protein